MNEITINSNVVNTIKVAFNSDDLWSYTEYVKNNVTTTTTTV